MRRDYREPDDFEYEPTAHDEVLKRSREQGTAAPTSNDRSPGPRQGSGIRGQRLHEFGGDQNEKFEGWNRPAPMTPGGDGELLEIAMGPHHPRPTASSAWM